MTGPFRTVGAFLVLSVAVASAASAQERVVRGVLVDTAGAPIAGHTIVLHTVSESGGQPIGQARSDAAGAFTIEVPSAIKPEAVIFAAVRLDGQLYLGPMLQGPTVPGEEYRIVAGGPSPFAGLGGARQQERGIVGGSPDRRGGPSPAVFFIFLPLAALLAFFFFRAFAEPEAEQRRLLLELAQVEERLRAGAPGEEHEVLEARRAALRNRLIGARVTGGAAA